MLLSEILKGIQKYELVNFEDVEISGLSYNSKTTSSGDMFICLKGEHSDGHQFVQMAVEKGAKALLCEKKLDTVLPQVIVDSSRQSIAQVSAAFYSYPSKELNLVGITGTNGKTTVTHLVQKIIEANNRKCGLIGTLGYKINSDSDYKEAKHTTPQAPELQSTLRMMVENKISDVVMEVSSHALEQNRVAGCDFNGAVFTNLTQDHLDYHITMNNYFDSKAILFKGLKEGAFAVINADDEYSQRFISVVPENVKILTYGVRNTADIMAKNIEFSIHGAECIFSFDNCEKPIKFQLNGMFSIYNALAAFAAGIAMGIDPSICISALEQTPSVAGRFEIVNKEPLVIVDYAHTPDGLENVLKAAREITPKGSNLICLFGCGGDRDATKRPKMGKIADEYADKIVVTSDNPRSEDPELIISDIMTGIKSVNTQRIFVESDRREAIKLTKTVANKNDVIVLAGKGHEDYQILKNETIHFDDREEARNVFANSGI